MADIRNIRARPGIRITLNQADMADIVTQPETMAHFSLDELAMIHTAVVAELERRTKSQCP